MISFPGAGTLNNIVSFTSDKIMKDSTIPISAISGYPYLPLAGGTMAGAIAMGTNSITNVGSLSGAVNTRTADNIVSNSGSSTSGDLCSFSGASGKVITDSAIVAANVVTNAGANVSGDIPSFSGISGKIIQDSGILAANVVTNAGINVSGDIPSFSGITGKII